MDGSTPPKGESGTDSNQWEPSTIEELLHSLIYEFRTPIMVIKGYALLLSDENHKELHPKAIEGILHSTERLETMLNQLLDEYRRLKN